jgi:hypothetical protein
MKLMKQLMEKKLNNQALYNVRRNFELSYQEHISVYLMALFILNKKDPNLRKKTSIWKRLINSKETKIKHYNKLLKYRFDEDTIINMAFNLFEDYKQKGINQNVVWRPFEVGMLGYEFEALQ